MGEPMWEIAMGVFGSSYLVIPPDGKSSNWGGNGELEKGIIPQKL